VSAELRDQGPSIKRFLAAHPAPAIMRPHGGPAFPMPALPACRSRPCPVFSFRNLFYISFFYPLLSGNKYASTL